MRKKRLKTKDPAYCFWLPRPDPFTITMLRGISEKCPFSERQIDKRQKTKKNTDKFTCISQSGAGAVLPPTFSLEKSHVSPCSLTQSPPVVVAAPVQNYTQKKERWGEKKGSYKFRREKGGKENRD